MAINEIDPRVGIATQFSSTNPPINPGRKKKILNVLREQYDIGSDDTKTLICSLFSMTMNELKEIISNESTPSLVVAFAVAILSSIKKGDISNIIALAEAADISNKKASLFGFESSGEQNINITIKKIEST